MLLAVIACVIGIVLENAKWPQDRSAAKERFVESNSTSEKLALLFGLVLSHSVVRWLIAFAVAASCVRVALEAPSLRDVLKSAVDAHTLSPILLDAYIGLAISALMVLFSLAARRLAR